MWDQMDKNYNKITQGKSVDFNKDPFASGRDPRDDDDN